MYVDAYKTDKDIIKVIERVNGSKVFREYKVKYVAYYEDPDGQYRTIWDVPCKKIEAKSSYDFKAALNTYQDKNIHESDINPIFRCLEDNYLDCESPDLNVAMFDIETDFDPDRGFADPWEPFAPITAISVYRKWKGDLLTFVMKPNLPEDHEYFLTFDEAEKITSEFENCILCDSEELLLELFLESISDVDVISGWNSSGYDIPYTVNRVKEVLGKEHMKRFNAFPNVFPKIRKYMKFKKENRTYDLIGRVHLDYLELYQKHAPAEMSSYRLDYIGEQEVGEHKVQYDGTLDMLYKKDFKKFIEYNRQDVMLLNKIDDKLKYIGLANQIAHTNTVLLQTTMGSVALVEQAIINETHKLGKIVPNRKKKYDEDMFDEEEYGFDINKGPAVGAHVADPKVGIHKEIGCCDINSLYPSAIRSLNMSPETLIGQIRNDRTNKFIEDRVKTGASVPEAWNKVFCLIEFDMVRNKTDDILILDFIDGSEVELTAKEVYEMIFKEGSNIILSSNGTLFTKNKKGIIPDLLEKWYSQRKTMQKKEKIFTNLINDGIVVPDDLLSQLV